MGTPAHTRAGHAECPSPVGASEPPTHSGWSSLPLPEFTLLPELFSYHFLQEPELLLWGTSTFPCHTLKEICVIPVQPQDVPSPQPLNSVPLV